MSRIAESELILNDRGAVYHLDLRPEELAGTVVTVGDPDRVSEFSKHFDTIEVKRQHREFVTHTGTVKGKRLTVLSSGIGPDNIDITMNELDALVNIDFATREIKPNLSSLNIIRVGTSGALQGDIPVDDFVASTHGLGIDNLLNFYRHEKSEEDIQLLQTFETHVNGLASAPYISSASPELLKHFSKDFHHGITVTCPGFYGPQGRVLRLNVQNPQMLERLTSFRFAQHRITNFEMETSAIYGLGKLLGHHCLALNVIVANRILKEFSKDSKTAIEKLIVKFLEIFANEI
jgi:uridine phosphorylase